MIRVKKKWLILTIILMFWFTMWTLAFILSLVIIIPGVGIKNNFNDNIVDNIIMIIFLSILLALIILLYVFRYKSNRFKYKITITQKDLILEVPQNNRTIYNINELEKYEVLEKIQNLAKVKIIFNDTYIIIKTRKYDELKNILEYLIEQKRKIVKNAILE